MLRYFWLNLLPKSKNAPVTRAKTLFSYTGCYALPLLTSPYSMKTVPRAVKIGIMFHSGMFIVTIVHYCPYCHTVYYPYCPYCPLLTLWCNCNAICKSLIATLPSKQNATVTISDDVPAEFVKESGSVNPIDSLWNVTTLKTRWK